MGESPFLQSCHLALFLRSSGLTLPSYREGVVGPDTVLVASDWIDRPVCDLSRSKSNLCVCVIPAGGNWPFFSPLKLPL
jgi:hypothetical protein